MRQEIVTRLRNSFAALLLDVAAEPPSPGALSVFSLPFSSMTEPDWRQAIELWNRHSRALLASLPERPCPACGSARSLWLFESYDTHQFHECVQCGCWFTPKVVDWSVFERFFEICPEAREHAAHMMGDRDEDVRNADMGRIGAYLDDLHPLVARQNGQAVAYLDAGCGVGASLRAGLARGLVVQGVEVDDAAVAIARKAGLPVALPSEIGTMARGPYQLLTFWETLEHIAAPLETIQTFLPFLADDGLVAITVPNLNAPATRIQRQACAWVHGGYNTPGHVNLFHARALQRLLERAGLALLDAVGQFSSQPLELLAYLAGESRGAFDILDTSLPKGSTPAYLGTLLDDVWPGLELLEQTALWSPILRVVACRRGQESRFAETFAKRRAARVERRAEEARRLLSFETDYKALSEAWQKLANDQHDALQAEVDKRDRDLLEKDRLLAERETHFQGEIQLRDRLLSDLRAKWESSLSFKLERLKARLAGRG
jgi:2-polyprenyl-3-methyl-5-hydroxy-6-metoxy-1,4-benzoquinol methylase